MKFKKVEGGKVMCFSFPPCFDHDAFMHHTMHILDVLDAPEVKRRKGRLRLIIRVSLVITHKFHL